MGEDRIGEPRDVPSADHVRLTVAQAADRLGITKGALRSRIKRGTLHTVKEAGRVYVVLGGGTSTSNHAPDDDEPPGEPSAPHGLLEELRDQVAYLREQLDREREARTEERRRQDTIIAQLSAANAEQARTIRAIESPTSSEPRGAPQTDAGEAEGSEVPVAEEPRSERSWWRRWFGFE
jgi:hypothetical protein